jgi:hypothetical protein
MDERSEGAARSKKTIVRTYNTGLYLYEVPVKIPGTSNRDSLVRSVDFKDSGDDAYASVAYSVKDKRAPPKKGMVCRCSEPVRENAS